MASGQRTFGSDARVSSSRTTPHSIGVSPRAYQELKTTLHRELLSQTDLEKLTSLEDSRARIQVQEAIQQLIVKLNTPLSTMERDRLSREVLAEVFGLGPLEPLLQDATINDILVNTHRRVYVERGGVLERTSVTFKDQAHLSHIIDKIVSRVGRRVDESSPMCDARLPDGSRVNVIIPPLAVDGPMVSIRRFGKIPIASEQLLANRTVTGPIFEVLKGAVRAKLYMIISGGTGAGKTTLLNVMSGYIGEAERIVTIEDSAELQLQQEHVVRLECRPPNVEGNGAVRQRELVINALRMRPDRIVVGEVRGEEALDMLQAMNTGHDGSLTTIHANSPRDAVARLETMALMSSLNLPDRAIRQQIASAVSVIVQIARLSDGKRRITHVTEITGMTGEVVAMQDIFVFDKLGIDAGGRVLGRFKATGVSPKFAERLRTSGIVLPPHHLRALIRGVERGESMSMISVFLILLVAVFATLAYFTEPSEEHKRVRERLVGLDRHVLEGREEGIMLRVTFSSIPTFDRFLRNHKLGPKVQLMLEQAKLPWTVGRFFFYSALMVVLVAVAGNWWITTAFFAWAPGVVAGFIPLFWAMYKRSGRFRRFNLQLPDAIDLISRALRAGHALPATLVLVADEMADPLGTEFRRTADELNYGLPFREALLNLNRRFPVRDLQFMVSAILVQKETGGTLAELLDKTATVLRSRLQLQQKVKVHTAQGRMTGAILFALPFLCFLLLNLVKPGYGDPLFENEVGRKMIYGTLISMTIGALVIRRIVRVKY